MGKGFRQRIGELIAGRSLTNTERFFEKYLQSSPDSAGEVVNEDTAMSVSAVFACVRVLSETVAQVPVNYLEKTDSGTQHLNDDPLSILVGLEPNPIMDSFTFRETMTINAALLGNAYALIERNNNNIPQALYPVHPDDVQEIRIDPEGRGMFYKVRDKKREVPERNMLHIKLLSKDGYRGRSVIDAAKMELGGALASKKFSNYFWENSAAPGLVVKVPSVLSQEAADRLKTNLQEFKKDKSGKTLPLEGGSEVTTTGIPQKDAQFLESMQFSKEQIASLFRIPPPMIADLNNANYSNVQALYMQFVKGTMNPWWNRWEMELNRKLRPANDTGRQRFFRFDAEGLLRGDTETRANYYASLIRSGAMTPNEAREAENMNRKDQDGADQLYKQQQDVPLGTPPQ